MEGDIVGDTAGDTLLEDDNPHSRGNNTERLQPTEVPCWSSSTRKPGGALTKKQRPEDKNLYKHNPGVPCHCHLIEQTGRD